MITVEPPYIPVLLLLIFILFIGFGVGNIFGEVGGPNEKRSIRWLLLIIPSGLGIFAILFFWYWIPQILPGS